MQLTWLRLGSEKNGSGNASFDVWIAIGNYKVKLTQVYPKKELTERDICTKFITPALTRSGWDIQMQLLEEFAFTDGRIYVKGKLTARGKRRRNQTHLQSALFSVPTHSAQVQCVKKIKSINIFQPRLQAEQLLQMPLHESFNYHKNLTNWRT